MEDPMMDNADAPPEESSNRTFIIVAGLLAGIFVLGLLALGAFIVFGPSRAAVVARQTQNAVVNATNTQIAAEATQIASLPTETPIPTNTATEAVTDTPAPTETPVVAPSDTPAPTDTQAASETPSGSTGGGDTPTVTITATPSRPTSTATGGTPGGGAGGGASATPTKLPSRTPSPVPPTVTVVGTGSGGAVLTATPIGLPNTGFADDVGVQNLLIVGLALIAIVIIARRLRYSLR